MPTIDLGLIITGQNRATSGLRSAGRDLDDLGNSVKKVGENSQATANRLKAIEVVIGGILIEKARELTKAFIDMAAANQNNDVRVAAWVGSMEKADQIMKQLNQTVGAAGVKIDNMGDAFVKLRAAGVSNADALKTVENLVNGIASVGGGDIDGKLTAAATAFQRFAAKGVVSTRELNAIVNSTGLNVKELADAMGVSVTQFYDQLKDKTTGAQVLLDAFNKAAHEKFGDFSTLLGSTISGSISKFKNDLDLAFGSLGGGSGLSTQIVAIIQNIDHAVTDFISHISKDDVEKFFQYFRDAAPVLSAVGELILLVGKAVIIVSDAAFRFASLLPTDAIEFGILGYVLMGKKGALLLGLIGTLTGQIKSLAGQVNAIASSYDSIATKSGKGYQGVLDALNNADPSHPIANMFTAMAGATVSWAHSVDNSLLPSLNKAKDTATSFLSAIGKQSGQGDIISKLLGSPEQLKAIDDAFDKLSKIKLGGTGLTEPPENTDLKGQLVALRQETDNLIQKTSGQDAMLRAKTAGDELSQQIQGITNQTDQWNAALELAAVKIASSKLPLEDQVRYEQMLGDLQKQINVDSDQAIAQTRILNSLKQQQLATELEIQKAGIAETSRQLALQTGAQNSNKFAFVSGTQGGTLSLQVDEQRVQYAQKILEYHQQIASLEVKATTDVANAAQYRDVEQQIQSLIDQTTTFASNLSATAELQTQFFKDLGAAMENDIASGLSGLIQGTESWGDVGRKVFGDLIDMSIKYLIQLAEIKAFQAVFGGAFADGGTFPGGIKPFANGGVPGLVTPFANGGLTTGPTLFGLAGEAGTEAIMPLTRIGGKLGVHATGGGGNTYNITVQAIDTETGMSFIGKHIGNIDAGLRQRQQLNRK